MFIYMIYNVYVTYIYIHIYYYIDYMYIPTTGRCSIYQCINKWVMAHPSQF